MVRLGRVRRTTRDLVLLDDAGIAHAGSAELRSSRRKLPDNLSEVLLWVRDANADTSTAGGNDVARIRRCCAAALIRESGERRRAECRADMQTEVVNLALDLLVREPDIEGFFGALAKAMVEESESHTCGVWLIDESGQRCDLWMAYVKDRLFTPRKDDWETSPPVTGQALAVRKPRPIICSTYRPGWNETVEYAGDDPRLPEPIRDLRLRYGFRDDRRDAARPWRPQSRVDDGLEPGRRRAGESVVARRADRGRGAAGRARAAPEPPRSISSPRRATKGRARGAKPPRARHSRQPGAGIRARS